MIWFLDNTLNNQNKEEDKMEIQVKTFADIDPTLIYECVGCGGISAGHNIQSEPLPSTVTIVGFPEDGLVQKCPICEKLNFFGMNVYTPPPTNIEEQDFSLDHNEPEMNTDREG